MYMHSLAWSIFTRKKNVLWHHQWCEDPESQITFCEMNTQKNDGKKILQLLYSAASNSPLNLFTFTCLNLFSCSFVFMDFVISGQWHVLKIVKNKLQQNIWLCTYTPPHNFLFFNLFLVLWNGAVYFRRLP